MARYHIAKSGEVAICKAQTDDACPLKSAHFASKDQAEFFIETIQRRLETGTSAPRMSDEDLRKAVRVALNGGSGSLPKGFPVSNDVRILIDAAYESGYDQGYEHGREYCLGLDA